MPTGVYTRKDSKELFAQSSALQASLRKAVVAHAEKKRGTGHILWLREQVAANHSNECILWPFYRDKDGYGVCPFEGSPRRAHRIAFFLRYGHWPMPNGLHICDNPPCFNPRHIVEGANADNASDMVTKGRSLRGERHNLAKLTDDQVRAIRDAFLRGMGVRALGREYNVTHQLVGLIVRRKIWKHVL
jgi:hypothetical protein